jgi:hypothetical protein
MRGKLISKLPEGKYQCTVCGAKPAAELHTAQGDFWWLPQTHLAPCGQPCIAGGITAPFRGHKGAGNCENPECTTSPPDKVKSYERAHLPTWVCRILLPLIERP